VVFNYIDIEKKLLYNIYNGTAIIMQKTGDNCIWYTYDENGLVTGFRYNGAEYYYFRNAQSDIIGIVNSSGSVVYFPWCKI